MEDFIRVFRSSAGDVYHITLSEDHSVLSSDAIGALHEVHVVGIELRRLAGKNTTGQEVLAAIESTIAEFFDSDVYEELKDFTVQKVNLTTPTSMLGLFIVI